MDDTMIDRSRELWNEDLTPTDAAHRTSTAVIMTMGRPDQNQPAGRLRVLTR
jgi:hypothetical protein